MAKTTLDWISDAGRHSGERIADRLWDRTGLRRNRVFLSEKRGLLQRIMLPRCRRPEVLGLRGVGAPR